MEVAGISTNQGLARPVKTPDVSCTGLVQARVFTFQDTTGTYQGVRAVPTKATRKRAGWLSFSSLQALSAGHVNELLSAAQLELQGLALTRGPATVIQADLSGDLLATVATIALKSRLASHEEVDAHIDCTLLGLMRGKVEGVRITGQGWRSPLQLSCRTLDVHVTDVQLDVGALVKEQLIKLVRPPRGGAAIAFSSEDFGNFLSHPLMVTASSTAVEGTPFHFLPAKGVQISNEPLLYGTESVGTNVHFTGRWEHTNKLYNVSLGVGNDVEEGGVFVTAKRANGNGLHETDVVKVQEGLRHFFANLALELDGTILRFSKMEFAWHENSQGERERVIRLSLDVIVNNFPPPKVNF